MSRSSRPPSVPPSVPRPALAVAAVVLVAAVLEWLLAGGTTWATQFEDLAELALSGGAALAAVLRAAASRGRLRASWVLLAAGTAAWCAGQGVWSWYEVGRGVDTPFPSTADVGFLVLPVAASLALLVHPANASALRRGRRLLDALMIATGLTLVSWETVLRAVGSAGGETPSALAVALAYPLLDLPVLALALLTLAGLTAGRVPFLLLATGLAALAGSDSAFACLSAAGTYGGGATDLGWMAGFVLLTLSALARERPAAPARGRSTSARPLPLLPLLPYVPTAAALATTLAVAAEGRLPGPGPLALLCAVVALLLGRQYLTLRENARLAADLAAREADLRREALHDSLTGLPNRALFHDRLAHALELFVRAGRPVQVLFLDLDDFKVVNDTLGHGAGDELLVRVAERLAGAVRQGDTVARLGGDEFAVLLAGVDRGVGGDATGDAAEVADRVASSLSAPFAVAGRRLPVRASTGIYALLPGDPPPTADDLLARADTAMYAAKRGGKGRTAVYRDGMSLAEIDQDRQARALERALRDGQVCLVYQPVVDLRTGRLEGLEALARWRDEGRDVPPDVFVPVAERAGLLGALTAYVLDAAAAQLALWAPAVSGPLRVAVNVPPGELVADGFVPLVDAVLQRHGLTGSRLTVEVTEAGEFGELARVQRAVAALRSRGVQVALDDFGTGYAALAQLHTLTLDHVKIDRSFVSRLEQDPRQLRLLEALLRLAADLELGVVVEGVERPEQLAVLRALDCPYAQGWLLGRPVPAEAVPALLGVCLAPAR